VLQRLARLLAPVGTASLTDSGGGRRRPFRGAVDGSRFTLRRVRASGRTSFVSVRGRVEEAGGGTRIHLALGLAGPGPVVALLALAVTGVGAGEVVRDAVRTGALDPARVWRLLAFAVVAAAIALATAWERGRVRRLLGYLTGEMTHAGLAQELAEARD